jgi:hypothetical protein
MISDSGSWELRPQLGPIVAPGDAKHNAEGVELPTGGRAVPAAGGCLYNNHDDDWGAPKDNLGKVHQSVRLRGHRARPPQSAADEELPLVHHGTWAVHQRRIRAQKWEKLICPLCRKKLTKINTKRQNYRDEIIIYHQIRMGLVCHSQSSRAA